MEIPYSREAELLADLKGLLRTQEPRQKRYDETLRAQYRGVYQAGQKKGFEPYAFARLYDERANLGIENIYQAFNARVDGYFSLKGIGHHTPVLLEIKTTMSWASLGAALVQFVAGKALLEQDGAFIDTDKGVLVFSSFSQDWIRDSTHPLRPWAQLYQHLDEIANGFEIWPLQLLPDGFCNPFLSLGETRMTLPELFERYLPGDVLCNLRPVVPRAARS